MNYTLLISTSSAIISVFALIITWMNFRISRKMPNENKLFEEKFQSYRSVILVINKAAGVYLESANGFQDVKGPSQIIKTAKDNFNKDLDKVYFLMEDTIYEQMLVLSDEVLEAIYSYIELFDQEDFLEQTATAGKTDEFEEKLNDLFDEVIDAMREDLAFDKLDKGLKNRIGSRHRSKVTVSSEIEE